VGSYPGAILRSSIPLGLPANAAGASVPGDLSVFCIVGGPLRQSGSRLNFRVFCVIGLVFQSACGNYVQFHPRIPLSISSLL